MVVCWERRPPATILREFAAVLLCGGVNLYAAAPGLVLCRETALAMALASAAATAMHNARQDLRSAPLVEIVYLSNRTS
jgi:hypothetical protein